jgi:hypothetical protein
MPEGTLRRQNVGPEKYYKNLLTRDIHGAILKPSNLIGIKTVGIKIT